MVFYITKIYEWMSKNFTLALDSNGFVFSLYVFRVLLQLCAPNLH